MSRNVKTKYPFNKLSVLTGLYDMSKKNTLSGAKIYYWRYLNLPTTVLSPKQLDDFALFVLENHLLHEITRLTIAGMLPFNPLSQTLSDKIFKYLKNF